MKKFLLEKGPYVRSVDEGKASSTRMMYDVVIALVPIVLFGWVLYGLLPFINHATGVYGLLKPLINVLVGCLCSLVFEGLYFCLFLKVKGFKNILVELNYSYAVIPGLILSLLFPVNIPLYVIIFGTFCANIIFKMLFGGLGHNIFNPALIGYAICFAAFGGVITDCLKELSVTLNSFNGTIVTSGTPLEAMAKAAESSGCFNIPRSIVDTYGGLLNLFIGFKNGNPAEVSGLLCVIAFVYLLLRRAINWRVPVIYVGTVFVVIYIIGICNHVEGPLLGIWFPTYNILTGGLLFGAVFMATEPVTTPKSPNGKIIFAVGCGVLTVLFRLVGSLPEGVGTSILFMCLFTPIIDKFASMNRGPVITSKIFFKYVLLGLLFALIVFYTIFKTTPLSGGAM